MRLRECTCGLGCWNLDGFALGVSERSQSEAVCSQCLLLSVVAWHTFLGRCTGHLGVSHECFGVVGNAKLIFAQLILLMPPLGLN